MKKILSLALLGVLSVPAFSADQMIYDSGQPKTVIFNAAESWLGFISGVSGSNLTRWAAADFAVGAGGATINKITANWNVITGSEVYPTQLKFAIWAYNGGNAPDGTLANPIAPLYSGKLGNIVANPDGTSDGTADPRLVDPDYTPWWGSLAATHFLRFTYHQYPLTGTGGVTGPITLPAGRYYLTIYGDTAVGGENCAIAWQSGPNGDTVAFNKNFMWRRSQTGGPFVVYNPTTVAATTFMGDPNERWNLSFQLMGTVARPAGAVHGQVIHNDFTGGAIQTLENQFNFQWRKPLVTTDGATVIGFRYPYITNSNGYNYQYSSPVTDDRSYVDTHGYRSATAPLGYRYYLTKKNTNNPLVADTTANFSMLNGDSDQDGVISIFDYIILSDAFDAAFGDSGYDKRADIDGDDVVSIFDYIAMSNNFDQGDE